MNLLGSLLLGYVAGRLAGSQDRFLGSLLAAGVLGALTTFSTFVVEIVDLATASGVGTAVLYAGTSVAFGLSLAVVGYRSGSR